MSGDPGYTEADLDAVSDNPEWTEEDFAQARPFHVLFPALAGTLRGPDEAAPASEDHVPVAIDRDLVDRFRAGGPGWEARLNAALRRAADAAA